MGGDDGAAHERWLSPLEVALGLIIVPLGAAAWVGLLTAQLGGLAPGAALGAAGLAAIGVLVAARRVGVRWRGSGWDWLALLLVAVIVLAARPAAAPWMTYLDASWYLNTAAAAAEAGALELQPAVLDVPDAVREGLVATFADQRAAGLPFPPDRARGFFDVVFAVPSVDRAQIVPYHPPLFASWVALWVRWRGVALAGQAVLPWAAAYLVAAAALARAALGERAAPLAVALLAVGPAFAYYGVTPYAELAAGALALGGLLALTRLATASADQPAPGVALAAGVALGLALLTKVDLAPAVALALPTWAALRRRVLVRPPFAEPLALGAGLGLPLLHGAWLARTVSAPYVALNGGGVLALATAAAVPLAAVALVVALVLALGVWRWRADPDGVRRALGALVVLGLVVATLAGLLRTDSDPPTAVEILYWLLTPLGLWAAAAGLTLELEAARRRAAVVVTYALALVPALLAAPIVTETLSPLYTARRWMPLVVPLAALFAAALAARAARPKRDVATRVTAAAGALLVVLVLARTARPFRAVRDFSGGWHLVERLAAYGAPDDVFLFGSTLDGSDAGRLAAPLWTLGDRATAVIGRPDAAPEVLGAAVDAWRADDRAVWLVVDADDTPPDVEGYGARRADANELTIITRALGPRPTLPARFSPLELRLAVYALEPVP